MPALPETAALQGQAGALLETVRRMSAGSSDCPEHEWEHGLRILTEAMAMHSRTRTVQEILAFVRRDDLPARCSKRSTFEHEHAVRTTSCADAGCAMVVADDDSGGEADYTAHCHSHLA